MDSVFGICGDDWVIVASDSVVAYSIMKLKVNTTSVFPNSTITIAFIYTNY